MPPWRHPINIHSRHRCRLRAFSIGTETHTIDPSVMIREHGFCVPVVTSHKRTVASLLPLASVLPSGLNVTLLTKPLCPVRSADSSPVRRYITRYRWYSQRQAGCQIRGIGYLARNPAVAEATLCTLWQTPLRNVRRSGVQWKNEK